jgi:hypothetical protein
MILNRRRLDITESDFNTCFGVKSIHPIHIWVRVGRSTSEVTWSGLGWNLRTSVWIFYQNFVLENGSVWRPLSGKFNSLSFDSKFKKNGVRSELEWVGAFFTNNQSKSCT